MWNCASQRARRGTAPPTVGHGSTGRGSVKSLKRCRGRRAVEPRCCIEAIFSAGHKRETIADGRLVPMRELQLGDALRTGPSPYDSSAAFMLIRCEPQAHAHFVRIDLDCCRPLLLTAGFHIAVAQGPMSTRSHDAGRRRIAAQHSIHRQSRFGRPLQSADQPWK